MNKFYIEVRGRKGWARQPTEFCKFKDALNFACKAERHEKTVRIVVELVVLVLEN